MVMYIQAFSAVREAEVHCAQPNLCYGALDNRDMHTMTALCVADIFTGSPCNCMKLAGRPPKLQGTPRLEPEPGQMVCVKQAFMHKQLSGRLVCSWGQLYIKGWE